MPCDIRVVAEVRIKSDVDDIERLEETLHELGINNVQAGDNVSYYVGGRTRNDAKLVIRPGAYNVNGQRFNINSDVAWVPTKKGGGMEMICEEGAMPKKLLDIITEAYANKTIKDEIGQWGGFVMDEQKTEDGFSIQIGDAVGKTTYVTVRDGVMDIQSFGGSPDVCSPVASGLKAALLGIEPHSHTHDGHHVHIGGEDHVH